MFKTLLSIVATLIRLVTTSALLVVIGFLAYAFKWYANTGETTTALCCVFTSFCAIGIIYFIWRKQNN